MTEHDQAIRARAFVEAAVSLLYQAQLATIEAVGHVNEDTRAATAAMQQAESLLSRLDRLIRVTAS